MARHYVGYTFRGRTTGKNVRTEDGYPLILMEEGETLRVSLDFANLLESGETISSASVTAKGITASISTASPVITVTLSSASAWGTATVTVTLSNGEVHVETIRARLAARAYDPAEVGYAI